MKKQTLYIILCAFFMAQFTFAKSVVSDFAVIRGKLLFGDNRIKDITIYNADDGKAVVAATSKINALGEFGFTLPIVASGFYYVDYGQFKKRQQLIRLYLEPKLDFDLTISENGYVLGGKSIGKNDLVQKANDVYNEFSNFSNMTKNVTYVDFYPFLDGGLVKAEAFKKTINTKDAKFNTFLKLAVDTDVEELCYMFFRMPRTAHPEKGNYPAVIKKWSADNKFTNPEILKLGNGISLLDSYFTFRLTSSGERLEYEKYFGDVVSQVPDPVLRDAFIRTKITDLRLKTEEYEKLMPQIKPYLTSKTSKDFLVGYEKELHKNIGQKGFEFSYKDVNDKQVSFIDFRGKYVYVDLWATWCGPCKAEIPYLKKLEEEYRAKNIVFVSLSLDKMKDMQKWKDYVKKEDLKGIQLMADKDFESDIAKNYEVNAIPRFLLFDKEGKIISVDEMRPSNPELRGQLDKLLKG